MEIDIETKTPLIRLRQYAIEENTFTPLSAFLSLCGLIVPFTESPDTIIPFLLILSPIYINKKSKILSIVLILIAVLWPVHGKHISKHWFSTIEQNDIIMRVLILLDAIYMIVAFRRPGKYKMTPSQIENNQFPILIWIIALAFVFNFYFASFVNLIKWTPKKYKTGLEGIMSLVFFHSVQPAMYSKSRKSKTNLPYYRHQMKI